MAYQKIGTQVYGVRKTLIARIVKNGKLFVGRVTGYEKIDGTLVQIIKEVGTKTILDHSFYQVFTKLDDALDAMS